MSIQSSAFNEVKNIGEPVSGAAFAYVDRRNDGFYFFFHIEKTTV
jgi:hypothetical protein